VLTEKNLSPKLFQLKFSFLARPVVFGRPKPELAFVILKQAFVALAVWPIVTSTSPRHDPDRRTTRGAPARGGVSRERLAEQSETGDLS